MCMKVAHSIHMDNPDVTSRGPQYSYGQSRCYFMWPTVFIWTIQMLLHVAHSIHMDNPDVTSCGPQYSYRWKNGVQTIWLTNPNKC